MKYFRFLFSGAFMGILLIVFAFAIGYATFVENDYDAVAARMLIYNAWWFELILFLMVVNFTGMIFTKKLYIKSKLNILFIHVALVIIIIGAGVTRYFGYEGQMHIRNGETSSQITSTDTYLYMKLNKGDYTEDFSDKVMLSTVKKNLFTRNINFQGEPIKVKLDKYLPNSVQKLVPTSNGISYLHLMVGTPDGRKEFFLKQGESVALNEFTLIFGASDQSENVSIAIKDGNLMIKVPESLNSEQAGSTGDQSDIGAYRPIRKMEVQRLGSTSFVVIDYVEKGELQYHPVPENSTSGIDITEANINGQTIYLKKGKQELVKIGDINASIYLGHMVYNLPFALQLNRFDLERYPGSESPSSYASEVTVIDDMNNNHFQYRIFMNNVLNYGGFRFFQSSYDQDERGTILSVNHDYWGTIITYIGYAMLFATLIISIFTRKTRIRNITHQINELHAYRKRVTVATSIALVLLTGTVSSTSAQITRSIEKEHAASFGTLLVQSQEGRIEPLNTMASEVLVKVYKKASYEGLNAEQVLLGIITNPEKWQNEPLIKVNDDEIKAILGINRGYASFSDVLDKNQYKLKDYVDKAYMKKPALRSTFDKEVIYVDERVNVLYMALNGTYLKIFPIPDHPGDKWINPVELHQQMGHGTEAGDMFENYTNALKEATISGNYAEADRALTVIRNFQDEYGKNIIPSNAKVKLEIFYNRMNIFKKLFPFYFMVGIILVGMFFLQTFNPRLHFARLRNILTGIVAVAFILQTLGLAIRWYISDHAPWSNGYESMIYIGWATMLAGFIFMKKSPAALGVTSVLAGITLLTAHMSWLNPEITNLVPVLKSYWLTFHVATITASYGFLALACMMGFLILCMMIFRNMENQERVDLMLNELTLIVELALSVGLILLVIGNFLGGIWANESWGRYWGWDPKETWTLVTIIFYSFVLHMRLIPGLRNTFSFNFFSVIGFGCVLMTYFGVNYYLSGLHSYANGDPVRVPSGVYYTLLVIFGVSILAAFNEFKMNAVKEAAKKYNLNSNGIPKKPTEKEQEQEPVG